MYCIFRVGLFIKMKSYYEGLCEFHIFLHMPTHEQNHLTYVSWFCINWFSSKDV